MILSCNSCDKKFVVPDNAISSSGRLVQCSSCGNKWKQFPIKQEQKKPKDNNETKKQIKAETKLVKISQPKKKKAKKRKGPDLYSPDYLIKKHGIRLDKNPVDKAKPLKKKQSIGFGFYSYLITLTVIGIIVLRTLYFTQNTIIDNFPILEPYINYLFESIYNIKVIIENFLLN